MRAPPILLLLPKLQKRNILFWRRLIYNFLHFSSQHLLREQAPEAWNYNLPDLSINKLLPPLARWYLNSRYRQHIIAQNLVMVLLQVVHILLYFLQQMAQRNSRYFQPSDKMKGTIPVAGQHYKEVALLWLVNFP